MARRRRVVRPAAAVPRAREIAVAIASRFCHEKFEARHALDSAVTLTSGSPNFSTMQHVEVGS